LILQPILYSPSPSSFLHIPPPTDTYTLSLHDALPISTGLGLYNAWVSEALYLAEGIRRIEASAAGASAPLMERAGAAVAERAARDRKSTRLNSSHDQISYAVFCLKKKNKKSSNEL